MADQPVGPQREPPDAQSEAGSEGGPVITLSKPWRITLAVGSLGLAVARVVWPKLPIDALALGLLVVAVLLLFSDIERVEWAGITASLRKRRLAKAAREVATVEVPAEPVPLSPAPEVAAAEAVSIGYGGLLHRKPFDLPPQQTWPSACSGPRRRSASS